ncbi:hypothetical protein ACLOJK_012371 [Asimina triloba]
MSRPVPTRPDPDFIYNRYVIASHSCRPSSRFAPSPRRTIRFSRSLPAFLPAGLPSQLLPSVSLFPPSRLPSHRPPKRCPAFSRLPPPFPVSLPPSSPVSLLFQRRLLFPPRVSASASISRLRFFPFPLAPPPLLLPDRRSCCRDPAPCCRDLVPDRRNRNGV